VTTASNSHCSWATSRRENPARGFPARSRTRRLSPPRLPELPPTHAACVSGRHSPPPLSARPPSLHPSRPGTRDQCREVPGACRQGHEPASSPAHEGRAGWLRAFALPLASEGKGWEVLQKGSAFEERVAPENVLGGLPRCQRGDSLGPPLTAPAWQKGSRAGDRVPRAPLPRLWSGLAACVQAISPC